jgi:Ser/Thr protein kinase RdoA (MazF antagonist)
MNAQLAEVARRFRFEGRLVEAQPYGTGHINRTYVIRCISPSGRPARYLLQRINHQVFREPAALMENIERITGHLREKIGLTGGDPERETLNLVFTDDGASFHQDAAGGFWRAFHFIEGARAFEAATSAEHARTGARAFGNFQRLLSDFPADTLHEVLPDFHNTPKRFATFIETVARDPVNRAGGVRPHIRFIEQRAEETAVLIDLLNQGRLPLRVTHNDAKFSNVLIDDATGEAVCVIDLDTVMPGSSLYDFGDAVRAGAALAPEDEPEVARAGLSLRMFEALTCGYLDTARDFLTRDEIKYLPSAARVIALEQAIRFLNDYLNGDVYYPVHRERHNLDRALTQIKMIEDMEANFGQMEAIVARY